MSNNNSNESKDSNEGALDKWKSDPKLMVDRPMKLPPRQIRCQKCGKEFKSGVELNDHNVSAHAT